MARRGWSVLLTCQKAHQAGHMLLLRQKGCLGRGGTEGRGSGLARPPFLVPLSQ